MLCRHAVYDSAPQRQKLEQLLKMIGLRMHIKNEAFSPAVSLLSGVVLVTVAGQKEGRQGEIDDEGGTAFWVVAAIMEALPPNYYGAALGFGAQAGPSSVAIEVAIFVELVQERQGKIIDYWRSIGMTSFEQIFTPWFECLFIHVLSWPVTLRFLDCLMVEGVKAVHRLGLTLLEKMAKTLMTLGEPHFSCMATGLFPVSVQRFPELLVLTDGWMGLLCG
jgi:hypothetical protein